MSARLIVLLTTIPERRASCARLLGELAAQSRPPDLIALVLDGYGADPAPTGPAPIALVQRNVTRQGPGTRWRAALSWLASGDLLPDDILVNLDDDCSTGEAPRLLERLAEAVEASGGAAAAVGLRPNGKRAPPGDTSFGDLVFGCGSGLALRARHLVGLEQLADAVKAAGGADMLGVLGQDDALVSAHLWKQGIPIRHAAAGEIHAAPGTQGSSITRARQELGGDPLAQKRELRTITGWPWPT